MLNGETTDLKDRLSPDYAGILCLKDFQLDFDHRGVSKEFLDLAGLYHDKYTDYESVKGFIQDGLELIGSVETPKVILDIGSGSGNSIFPLLEMFPMAQLTATDISPQLLKILRDLLAYKSYKDRVNLLCVDLCEVDFKENSFDLGVGAAILHHIIDPRTLIRQCLRGVKPGGWLMFVEPFEVGSSLIKMAFTMILNLSGYRDSIKLWTNVLPDVTGTYPWPDDKTWKDRIKKMMFKNRRFAISERTAVFMINCVRDLEFRKGRDKSHPQYTKMDDKWLFTRKYFEDVASDLGVSELLIRPLKERANRLEKTALIYFGLALGQKHEALPNWAWQIIRDFDDFFSDDLSEELYPEGLVLLKK